MVNWKEQLNASDLMGDTGIAARHLKNKPAFEGYARFGGTYLLEPDWHSGKVLYTASFRPKGSSGWSVDILPPAKPQLAAERYPLRKAKQLVETREKAVAIVQEHLRNLVISSKLTSRDAAEQLLSL